jgi:hypothetical protein
MQMMTKILRRSFSAWSARTASGGDVNQRVAPDPLSDPVGEAPSEDEDSAVPPRIRGYTFDDLELAAQPEGRDELTRYLALDKTDYLEQRGAFDLFGWWSQHQRTFPVLYNLALEFLSIPASSATVERQFSKAKLIHSPRRQSMSGKRLGDLVFLREHLDTIDHIEPTMPRDESDEE